MKLHLQSDCGVTIIQNTFIDRYMPAANGEFVKLYLYLLRCAGTGRDVSISSIADFFDHTEKDVSRALAYWEKLKLLKICYAQDGSVSDILFLDSSDAAAENGSAQFQAQASPVSPAASAEAVSFSGTSPQENSAILTGMAAQAASPAIAGQAVSQALAGQAASPAIAGQIMPDVMAGAAGISSAAASVSISAPAPAGEPAAAEIPDKKSLSPARRRELKAQDDIRQLIFVAQSYMARPLTSTEVNNLLYFYEALRFSPDLIEYLVEYCASKGNPGARYMEKVALGWYREGITTVEEAKQSSAQYQREYYDIFEALGIRGRSPVKKEIEYMDRWLHEYGFNPELIREACSRTIMQTHQPSLSYVESILKNWHAKNVQTMEDIRALDLAHSQAKSAPAARAASASRTSPRVISSNRFNNFPQREYDWNVLEQELLQAQTVKGE